ncbi:MAG: cysteine-rich CWC family protein [Syntrophobacteria bacterium]|jgi:hypothetical protein
MKEHVDKSICPICGKPNDCLLAKESRQSDEDCWCRFEHFPEDLLKLVPADKNGQACICRDCLRKFHRKASSHEPQEK